MKNIVIDIDGVLADFASQFKKLFGYIKHGAEWEVTKEEWQKIRDTPDFWRTMPPLPGAETLAALSPLNDNFYLLTSRSGAQTSDDTRLWLVENGIEVAGHRNLIFTSRPGKIDELRRLAPAFFLDDSILNAGMADKADYVNAYLMLAPHNKEAARYFPDMPHVATVKEFLEAVKRK